MASFNALEIVKAEATDDIAAVKAIFLEYLAFIEDYLGQTLAFQGTEAEFKNFPQIYDVLFLAKYENEPIAACGIKPFKDEICELKRLYCRPIARGKGSGEALMRAAIQSAKQLGYKQIYLDTDHGLIHANAIYEKLGFMDIEKYYDNPMDSRFMAKAL